MRSEAGAGPTHPLRLLALETARHLRGLEVRGANRAIRDGFAAEIADTTVLPIGDGYGPAASVRGLRHAPIALGSVPDAVPTDLARAARSAFGHLRWTEFYEADPWSAPFLADFANGEGIGPDGSVACGTVILGLFILGPDTLYPPHAHPAEEFYLCLSGGPQFQIGPDAPFHSLAPGEVAWHGSDVSHAIRTGPDPFLAVFGWHGAIRERSWYRVDMGDPRGRKRYPTISKGRGGAGPDRPSRTAWPSAGAGAAAYSGRCTATK